MFFIWLVLLPFFVMERATDPSPGFFQSKADARNLDCARLDQAKAHQLHPDRVPDVPARDLAGGSSEALVCASRIMRLHERPARDEAILSSLRQRVGEIAQLASALHPEEITWHVDAFYPDAAVAAKIAVAARTDLAERGRRVSDRIPVLAAGDIAVLGRLPPREAYPLACARYLAHQALGAEDALLGVMLLDPRETALHAGLCLRGEWRWLR
jgi:hypothetical protein